ncbi:MULTISPECIES: NUDIX hydrolase [Glycomyces]|uniref:8-oxo-dGTP diphosphatase n=1 Tax=Glycomyces artemisiae TaxID=1076443 RepID=A0A2T0UME7_9ACTN|nr:NUDIX domain-containing protein [Glycomyces artemisiae]NUQ89523.1 NUDIX hydrolase [Glycomyces artemisiae]PRY59105.1 8-oxo-dGTP diphosphatase [Glycomyces artemisiae]
MRDRSPLVQLTADVVILTVREDRLEVLLIRRGKAPFEGMLAIPGGYMEADENLWQTAIRELEEETSLDGMTPHLELVGVYTDPERDPRGQIASGAWVAMIPDPPVAKAGGDAAATEWLPVDQALKEPLAFDHKLILQDAVEKARQSLNQSTAAVSFCRKEFTISELRRVYEAVWGGKLDPGNFHRKVTRIDGFIEPTGETTTRDGGRPAALYRAGARRWLPPSIPRPEVSA